jgi:hypothetical protein
MINRKVVRIYLSQSPKYVSNFIDNMGTIQVSSLIGKELVKCISIILATCPLSTWANSSDSIQAANFGDNANADQFYSHFKAETYCELERITLVLCSLWFDLG